MGHVDQVTQRNASAAEELSSTAEEMASQAESLQQLINFFRVNPSTVQAEANALDADHQRLSSEAAKTATRRGGAGRAPLNHHHPRRDNYDGDGEFKSF
jgi:methyl-accepting chemotaxis protein